MEALHPPSISFWGSGLEHSLESRKDKVSGRNQDEGGREREDRGKRQVINYERTRQRQRTNRERERHGDRDREIETERPRNSHRQEKEK